MIDKVIEIIKEGIKGVKEIEIRTLQLQEEKKNKPPREVKERKKADYRITLKTPLGDKWTEDFIAKKIKKPVTDIPIPDSSMKEIEDQKKPSYKITSKRRLDGPWLDAIINKIKKSIPNVSPKNPKGDAFNRDESQLGK